MLVARGYVQVLFGMTTQNWNQFVSEDIQRIAQDQKRIGYHIHLRVAKKKNWINVVYKQATRWRWLVDRPIFAAVFWHLVLESVATISKIRSDFVNKSWFMVGKPWEKASDKPNIITYISVMAACINVTKLLWDTHCILVYHQKPPWQQSLRKIRRVGGRKNPIIV